MLRIGLQHFTANLKSNKNKWRRKLRLILWHGASPQGDIVVMLVFVMHASETVGHMLKAVIKITNLLVHCVLHRYMTMYAEFYRSMSGWFGVIVFSVFHLHQESML